MLYSVHKMTAESTRRLPRRERERAIVEATRALFDARGAQDAPMDDIAQAVGVTKTLLYRYFESKEDLVFRTTVLYLEDLEAALAEGDDPAAPPPERLAGLAERFADFCLRYPAFLDCAFGLMRRPAGELREVVSDVVWFRLGQAMAAPLGRLVRLLEDGVETGDFAVEDPLLTANVLYAQVIGGLHLARIGIGIGSRPDGSPAVAALEPARVRRQTIDTLLAAVRR